MKCELSGLRKAGKDGTWSFWHLSYASFITAQGMELSVTTATHQKTQLHKSTSWSLGHWNWFNMKGIKLTWCSSPKDSPATINSPGPNIHSWLSQGSGTQVGGAASSFPLPGSAGTGQYQDAALLLTSRETEEEYSPNQWQQVHYL